MRILQAQNQAANVQASSANVQGFHAPNIPATNANYQIYDIINSRTNILVGSLVRRLARTNAEPSDTTYLPRRRAALRSPPPPRPSFAAATTRGPLFTYGVSSARLLRVTLVFKECWSGHVQCTRTYTPILDSGIDVKLCTVLFAANQRHHIPVELIHTCAFNGYPERHDIVLYSCGSNSINLERFASRPFNI